MYEDTGTIGNMVWKLGAVIYSPHKIILSLCFIVILFLVGFVVYNMKYIKGRRVFSICYANDYYIYSTLDYKENKVDVIIDTGAQRSILNSSVLNIMPNKINRRIIVNLTNILGRNTKGQMAKVKIIKFGDSELKNFKFVISSDIFNSIPELQNIQGIIGIDILKYFDLHFSANKYVLILEKPVSNEMDPEIWGSTKLMEKNNFWGMYVSIGGKQFFAIIDTGLPSYLVIPASLQRDIAWYEPTNDELSFFDLWDEKSNEGMTRIIVKELKIFDEEILNLPVVMDSGTNQIMVGLDFLSEFDLIISYKRKKIYFKK